ncbi:MAG TPA: hypothetical protein VGL29_01395 [Blastocatellia bacterium]|jgi:tetratricopeptide (TPR) repeat protein
MKKLLTPLTALMLSLALFVPLAPAKTVRIDEVAQDPAAEEAAAYKAWFEANQAKDYVKAMELAKAYLEKFPNGNATNVAYLKKWIPQIRGYLFNQAVTAGNMGEMIRLGKEALASDPDNLDYLWVMINQIRAKELYASPPNNSHASEYAEFSKQAMRIVEAGKTPTGAKDFKKGSALAFLNYDLGTIESRNKNVDKALEYNSKAASLDPAEPAYFFACGNLYQQKYAVAAQKFQSFPEADQQAANEGKPDAKPEVKAALDEANKHADALIDCWARYVALTTGKKEYDPVRTNVEKELAKLYNYRHPDSPDGLQKLIQQYRSGSSSPPQTATANSTVKP